MKTVLVTGSAGFIGSHVAETLLRRGDHVIGFDNLNDYYPIAYKERNLRALYEFGDFFFVKGDVSDLLSLEPIFRSKQITHVAHLAARAGVRPSIENAKLYCQANIDGTLNLLELARNYKIESFVLTSSSSVYGNSRQIPFRENDSATDLPISPYAATKKATEVLGYTYHHLYGLNVNVIRPFTVYGPRGRPDMAPWLFLERALDGKPIRKFGDGTTRRDYTYISDFVNGFIQAIDRPYGYEVFNLGKSATVSLNEMIEIVQEISGVKVEVQSESMQPGDVECTNADISKAREKLSYNPTTSFRDGMKQFYEWFVDQRL